ncbi:MAG: sodium:alanine symporter family protein, partial [Candidatus Omnitrophica bacterium]|nr:sodium:alanine symporter family protein [Candidatus Omnitrophota bacterium]
MLKVIYSLVWGLPLLGLMLGVGFYYTIILRGIQFRYLFPALKMVFWDKPKKGRGDISPFASLMTTLAATLGIGNIAGVATAITVGGMGAIFWMWVTALIGMAVRYAESILAVRYRTIDAKGEMCGGPMYYIGNQLKWNTLAAAFAFFGIGTALGGGNMLQGNSVADVLDSMAGIPPWVSGLLVAFFIGLSVLGGIKSIGLVATYLVPFMSLFYLLSALFILIIHAAAIPDVFQTIFSTAFQGQAAFGGYMGSTLLMTIQVGLSRGLMTSEAGLGTGSIAAAAAKTDYPARQALISMTGCFLSTIVMCTITALVLGVTNVFGLSGTHGNLLTGASLTVTAFNTDIPWGGHLVMTSILFFAVTTILGYAYYGEKCVEYLFGLAFVPAWRLLFVFFVFLGAILELDIVWGFSDIFNGLMAFPNLLA